MARAKQKGNTYEREVVDFLSELFDAPFQRTAFSGAFTGRSNKHRKDRMDDRLSQAFIGDVTPPSNFNVVIECKSYAPETFKGGFHQVMQGTSQILDGWIGEVRTDADDGKQPHFVTFKITRLGSFYVFPVKIFADAFEELKEDMFSFTIYPFYYGTEPDEYEPYFIVSKDNVEYIKEGLEKAMIKE